VALFEEQTNFSFYFFVQALFIFNRPGPFFPFTFPSTAAILKKIFIFRKQISFDSCAGLRHN
jgi:hypothetical protein